jgi:hypothetical protein
MEKVTFQELQNRKHTCAIVNTMCKLQEDVQKYAFCAASVENDTQHVHVSLFFAQNTTKHVLSQNTNKKFAKCTSIPFLDFFQILEHVLFSKREYAALCST